ncbi:MAG: cupin domain-containing protein [Planctomycetes bacterium]|nr:cupin domain-containing protein [Planctomycetota bacterium]
MPRSYLHDRVRVERLKADAPDTGPMRRMSDKGEMAQIMSGDLPPVQHLMIWTLNPGHTRGRHFHTNRVERIYVVHGEIEILIQPNDKSLPGMLVPVIAGERVTIDHGVAHCYRLRGTTPATVLEMGEQPYNPLNPDTTPFDGFPQ